VTISPLPSSVWSPGPWLADLCAQEGIPFVLGHALSMKAIHGGKTKHDTIDAHKIAVLLRGGMLPQASVYPAEMRATRDLLRRRMSLMRQRAALLAHVQNPNSQSNLPEIGKKLAYKVNRTGVADRFPEPSVRKTVEVDLQLIDYDDELLRELALYIVETAKHHDVQTFYRLRSIPGVGKILALVLLYAIHDITRFPRVQEFVSYARLVQCPRESAGKRAGTGDHTIGNVHLKWAFSEAAVLFLRNNPLGQAHLAKLARKHGKAKAPSILAPQLGRAVYFMLKRHEAFDMRKFLAT
jgi:transposase